MMQSPCIKLCVLDPVTGFCIGCGRTGNEIGAWATMPRNEQDALMAALPDRLEHMTTRDARRGRQHARTTAR